MSDVIPDLATVERADDAFAAGDTALSAQMYVALLQAHPDELYLWYRNALLLGRLGDGAGAARHLNLAAARLAETGEPLLALAAAKELDRYDKELAGARIRAIAELYGKGSDRLDTQRRSVPPPLPEQLEARLAAGDLGDPRVAREAVLDACEQAAQQPEDKEQKLGYRPLLSELSPDELVTLEPLMQLGSRSAGEVVIEQGDEGRSFFILARGIVRVTRQVAGEEPIHLARLRPGVFFGEMALLTDSQRTARVTCETAALLFEVDRRALEQLAERNPRVATVLVDYTRTRLLRNLMATSPLFEPLSQSRRESLVELFESVLFEPGEVVVAEGQSSRSLFVVLNGSVLVEKGAGEEQLRLAELGAGQIFGEISLIKDREATATVRAARKTVLLALSRETFNQHVVEFPEVLAHVYRVAVEREEANLQLESSVTLDVGEDLLI